MSPQFHFTSHANLDLDEIAFSIAQDDPTAAENFVDRLTQLCHVLAEHPYLGRERARTRSGHPKLAYRGVSALLPPDGILVLRILS